MRVKRLFNDETFHNGIQLIALEHTENFGNRYLDDIPFPESEGRAEWQVCQWYSKYSFENDRIPTDPHIISDGHVKEITYNPKEASLTLRLNARNVYEGHAHTKDWGFWPHLLMEQKVLADFEHMSKEEMDMYSADCDKTVFHIDLRMTDFKDTTNKEGINACQFLAYFYLTLKEDPTRFIWYGLNLFDDRAPIAPLWKMDCTGAGMIYLLSTEETYNGDMGNFFFVPGTRPVASDKWHDVTVDLSEHFDRCIARCNAENTFGRPVTRSDFYVRGNNIGFEIHGNYDCTFEFKNYQMIFERND